MEGLKLEEIEARLATITPGKWYAHATDDHMFMNARYVSIEPNERFEHDGGNGMDWGGDDQADSSKVIAVTLLQAPRLVDPDQCDENTVFIAHAPDDIRALISEVKRLRMTVDALLHGD